ncbi:MAG: hypothetical protein NTU60_08935 [Candidatus Aminicenantes bacterium]|nr:hypothetical protein [Candidatus Aminicenantes bacterium]
MSKKSALLAFLMLGAGANALLASSYLFYLEAQGVAGWSSAAKKAVFFSMSREEVMQKPGLGFDFVQRFSGASGDFAVLAIQGRLSVNAEGGKTLEPQIYNAYLKMKTGLADFWIGHNKPKFGLSDVLDNHATLLQPLSMMGFGFDRDWGAGVERDTAWGSAGLSLTTGSGMALKTGGNYFLAGRISKGVLGQDNFSGGFSAALGRIYDVAGYERISETPMKFLMAGVDLTWRRDNWEHNFEVMAGSRDERGAAAVFWRTGLGLLEESRLKLEAQPVFMVMQGSAQFQFAVGATYLAHPDWTLRTMVAYDSELKDTKVLFQIYYYKGIRF